MSTTTNKKSIRGIRYTDSQKKEVVDYALDYNSQNGRGGQSKAAEKFNISPLTVATWMKAAGSSPSGKTAAARSAATKRETTAAPAATSDSKEESPAASASPAASGKSMGKGRPGARYTDEQKQEVTDFVAEYNQANGRGGASLAAKKFGIAPLTITAWLKAAGAPTKGKKTRQKYGTGTKTKAAKEAAKATKATPTKAATTKAAPAASSASSDDNDLSSKLSSMLELRKQISAVEEELANLNDEFNSLKNSL